MLTVYVCVGLSVRRRDESSLCSGVVELILPRSIEARLNTAVAPQPLDHGS